MWAHVFKAGTSEGAQRAWETRRSGANPRPQSLQDDARRQIAYLNRHARSRGYTDLEEMFRKDPDSFAYLAAQWRKEHPVLKGFGFVFKEDLSQADLAVAGGKLPEQGMKRRRRRVLV
jgi:hypothetical protein